jgi:hypothetical protein
MLEIFSQGCTNATGKNYSGENNRATPISGIPHAKIRDFPIASAQTKMHNISTALWYIIIRKAR